MLGVGEKHRCLAEASPGADLKQFGFE